MNKITEVQRAWSKASVDLGFEIKIPFHFNSKIFDGHLPHFGSSNGMVFHIQDFSAKTDVDRTISIELQKEEIYQSVIGYSTYRKYERDIFTEALIDWGYHGPVEKKPSWYDLEVKKTLEQDTHLNSEKRPASLHEIV